MNTETVKQLLKKAMILNDPELIELANSLLEIDETTDTISDTVFPKYHCLKCDEQFDTPKGKKSCPKCNGRKIEQINIKQTPKQTIIEHPSKIQVNRKLEPRQLDLKKMAEILSQIPVEGDVSADAIIKSKIEQGKIQRSARRPEATLVNVSCDKCGKKYAVSQKLASRYFVCVKCVKV